MPHHIDRFFSLRRSFVTFLTHCLVNCCFGVSFGTSSLTTVGKLFKCCNGEWCFSVACFAFPSCILRLNNVGTETGVLSARVSFSGSCLYKAVFAVSSGAAVALLWSVVLWSRTQIVISLLVGVCETYENRQTAFPSSLSQSH